MNKVFDAHLHIIEPNYPLIKNQGYLPDPYTVTDYQNHVKNYNIVGGAIVSGSFQAFDQTYLIAALKKLGPNYIGVTQLPVTTADADIIKLNKFGVRAVRFNLFRGGSEDIKHLSSFAHRLYDLVKWHVELYVDASTLTPILDLIKKLPKASIDHLGLKQAGFNNLMQLVDAGHHVKATGFMRVDFDPLVILKKIYAINPNALLFGTDLPGTRATRTFDKDDLALLTENFDDTALDNILYQNAIDFYAPSFNG